MCITDQHLGHARVEIDDFIYTKVNRIPLQNFTKYSALMKEFSEILSEASSNFDQVFEKITEEYVQMQQPLGDDIIDWRMKMNVLLIGLIERVKNHREDIRIVIEQADMIRRETDTFQSLSMITTILEKLKLLFQSDVEINLTLKKIHKENIPEERVADQHRDCWAAVTSKLQKNKDKAYYPHSDMQMSTGFDQFYRNAFLCSKQDGAYFVAGINMEQKFKIRLISRLGELLWENELDRITAPDKEFNYVNDIEEIEDPDGTRWILCSNCIEHQIIKISFSNGDVEEVVFEHPTIAPYFMTAAPENSRLYVVDVACVQALDTTKCPYQVLPTWEPLEINSYQPVKILHLPQTKSLLIAVRSKGMNEQRGHFKV